MLSGRSDILLMEALTFNLLYVSYVDRIIKSRLYASEGQVFTF